MSAVADKLREAKALVGRGWCKGVSYKSSRRGSSYCAWRALRIVGADRTAFELLADATSQPGRDPDSRIIVFNDNSTKPQVVAAFDRAIAEASQ